jgi:APA family basic amino acid/polyamine antiporter
MSRDGLLHRAVASVNPGGTPAIALLLASLAGIALILSGSFEKLVAVASILFVVVYLSGFCALFALRIREPNLARPFKLWGYPWTNLAVLVASVAFLVASIFGDLKNALFTLILIALSVPIYFLLVKGISRREAATITAAPDVLIPPE